MDKLSTIASPNCHSFMSSSEHFVRSRMNTINYGAQRPFGFQVRVW